MRLFPECDPEIPGALFKSFISALCLTALFYSSGAYAVGATTVSASTSSLDTNFNTTSVSGITASMPDLAAMLVNFATAVPNFTRLVTAGAYVIGMFFIIVAVMGMKHFGEMRTMQSREHGVWGPIIELLIGAALIYLPSSVQGVMSTFWTSTNPYAYLTSSTALNSAFVDACYSVIQLIGVIAFIRGLIMLQQAGSERAQPHMLGKALSHLVGGILCINLYGTIQTLEATVGMISS